MQKLTVREYALEQNVSEKTVYQWVRSDKVKHIKETRNNQEVTIILVDTVQSNVKPTSNQFEQNSSLQLQSEAIVNNQIQQSEYLELIKRMYADNASLSERNSQLSELAGQAKLLTDSEHRTKQEYFKIVQENKQLLQEKTIVETENMMINKQLEELKQKLDNVEKKENNNWWSKL